MPTALATPESVSSARRVRVPYVVEVTVSSEHNFWSGFTSNLSEGGVFIATPSELAVGTTVQFELRLPTTSRPWVVRGEVRWTRRAEAAGVDTPPGIGVRFVDLDPVLEREIAAFVGGRDAYFFDES